MAQRSKTLDLTSGSISANIFYMSFPLVWGALAIIGLQITDVFFIGQLENTDKLAAVSFTFPLIALVGNIFFSMSIAITSVLSRQIGENNTQDIKRLYTHGLILTFLFTAIVSFLCYVSLGSIFALFQPPEHIQPDILLYMSYWLVGSVFFYVSVMNNGAMRAMGDSITPVILIIITALVNVVLDPVLIFGLAGFPALGIEGAAIASLVASIFFFVASMTSIQAGKRLLDLRYFMILSQFRDSLIKVFSIALPTSGTNIIKPLTANIVLALLSTYGAEIIAAYGVITRIEAFAFLFSTALTTGITPIIGQAWGAKKYDRMKKTLYFTLGYCSILTVLVAVILAAFSKELAGLFSVNKNVIRIIAIYLTFIPMSFVFAYWVSAWSSAFNAIGTPKYSFFMLFWRMALINLPLAYLGHVEFGIWGIWGGIALGNIVSGVAFHIYNRKIIDTKIRLASPILET